MIMIMIVLLLVIIFTNKLDSVFYLNYVGIVILMQTMSNKT